MGVNNHDAQKDKTRLGNITLLLSFRRCGYLAHDSAIG